MFFRHYEYFVAIVECGGLNRAAEQLYVSQPSLSQYLKRLEGELGVKLFDRSRSPLKLTYAGECYYHSVKEVMRLEDDLKQEFENINNSYSGILRLGLPVWRSSCLLPDIFPKFHEKYPGIKLELTEEAASKLEDDVIKDNIDMAVINLSHSSDYSRFTCEPLMEERILLAAPTSHPYVSALLESPRYCDGYPVATLEVLERIPIIMLKPGQNLTGEIQWALEKNHLNPDIIMETSNTTTAVNMSATGICCAFVPSEGAKIYQQPDKLTYFVLDSSDFIWELAAISRNSSPPSRFSRIFIDFLKEML